MIAAFALDAHATKSVNANAIVRRAELIATFRTFEIDSSEYSASGVCVFGVGCVYSAADGGACLSRARVRRTTDPTRSIDRRAPTDARARPTPTADPHPAEVRGVHPSYSTRASRRVRAINLFYVPLYTQTSYCARIRPSRVARDGVRADDRGRGHARDATRYCTGCSLEYSVVWTLIRAIGRGRRAAIHVSGGRRRRAGARAVT